MGAVDIRMGVILFFLARLVGGASKIILLGELESLGGGVGDGPSSVGLGASDNDPLAVVAVTVLQALASFSSVATGVGIR